MTDSVVKLENVLKDQQMEYFPHLTQSSTMIGEYGLFQADL